MSSEFGYEPSGPAGVWGPPGHGGPGSPQPYAGPPWSPPDPPDLPSRRATVLVTAFFGLFGLIPATRHGRRAEQLGVSGSRYFTAFGITFGATVLAWVCVVAAVLVSTPGDGDPGQLVGAGGGSRTGDKAKEAVQRVEGEWTAEELLPALDAFADDEVTWNGEDYGFTHRGALIPCGAQDQFLAEDFIDTIMGGYGFVASAQFLPGPEAAERELARQTEILQGCTAGYEVYDEVGNTLICEASIQTLTPVVRYREDCDDDYNSDLYVIFRADNAVITVFSHTEASLDRRLPELMSALDAD